MGALKTILIILLILIFLGAIAGGMYLIVTREQPEVIEYADLIIKCVDFFNNEPCSIDFQVEDQNGTVYLKGTAGGEWTEFNSSIPENKLYYIWGNSEQHYTKKVSIDSDKRYLIEYRAIKKATNISITIDDTSISITPQDGMISYMAICTAWTYGYFDVSLKSFVKECETTFVNYTDYNPQTQEYTYLPKGQYLCKDELFNCKKTKANYCYLPDMQVPERYSTKADKCFEIGKTLLTNETFTTELKITETEYIDSTDYFTIYLLDHDRTKINNKYIYKHSLNNQDIGIEDYEHRIGS